jgi:hypothetical protein
VSPEIPDFNPEQMLRVLARHHVDYVLIGGLAAILHGSALSTNDADICPERSRGNVERLAAALREVEARNRTASEPDGVPFACDGEMLERMKMLNLVTTVGWFDVCFEPGGFPGGFEQLSPHAVEIRVDDFTVRVASLHDVIASKEAANRDKDRAALPHLYALEDEIAAIEREGRE